MSKSDDFDKTIVDAVARAFHVNAFAELNDRRAEDGLSYVSPGPGGDWMDIAPNTPAAAKALAKKFVAQMEKDNDGTSVIDLYIDALRVPGKRYGNRNSPADFGFGFAMQALGHGVSWFDDNPKFPIKVPDAYFSYDGSPSRPQVVEASIGTSRGRG